MGENINKKAWKLLHEEVIEREKVVAICSNIKNDNVIEIVGAFGTFIIHRNRIEDFNKRFLKKIPIRYIQESRGLLRSSWINDVDKYLRTTSKKFDISEELEMIN